MTSDIQISILVATRNRAAFLARLLSGLSVQLSTISFEVIVCDNGSSDDTADVVERAKTKLMIRYVQEKRPGKSRALNAAIKLARGDLVVFTDDDVLPKTDWLSQLHAATLRYPNVNIFGGRIDVNRKAVPEWILRSFNLMSLLTAAHSLGENHVYYGYGAYPFGPNMAIRRKVIDGFEAPYPEDLGPGTALPTGDETGFLIQFSPPSAIDRLFVPSARVVHEVEAENVIFKTALIRCFLAGRAIGSLGLPPVAKHNPKTVSTPMVIIERLNSCASPQEFACITVRYFGYILERFRVRRSYRN